MSEWNYNLEEAPVDTYVLASCTFASRRFVIEGYKVCHDGAFLDVDGDQLSNAYAWMPLPDPAPLPEGD